jgi:hypothetical protein
MKKAAVRESRPTLVLGFFVSLRKGIAELFVCGRCVYPDVGPRS